MSTVVVTGASGFIGRRLSALLVARGDRVVAPVRSEEARLRLPQGVEAVMLKDNLDAELLAPLLAGADAVVHLAARVHVMTERAADPATEYHRINVEGTRAVARAAHAAGVRRFVYVSSIKVNGENREAPYTEFDAPRPLDPYGQSKLDAERVVRSNGALSWTIVRPPLVYGPEVGGNFRRLLQLARLAGRWPVPLGGMDNLRSLIFIDNLASALAATTVHPAAHQQTFLVSDDHDVGTSELLQRLAIGLGGRPRLFRAPAGLLRQAGSLFGREADLDRLLGTLRINSSFIQSTLGWRPSVSLEAALETTAQWWRAARMKS